MKKIALTSFLAISLFGNGLTQAMSSDFYCGFLAASASITGLGIGFYCCYKKLANQYTERKQSLKRNSDSNGLQEQIDQLQAEKQQLALQLNQIQIKQKNIVASVPQHQLAHIIKQSLDKQECDECNKLQNNIESLRSKLHNIQQEKESIENCLYVITTAIKASGKPLFFEKSAAFTLDDFNELKKYGLNTAQNKKRIRIDGWLPYDNLNVPTKSLPKTPQPKSQQEPLPVNTPLVIGPSTLAIN